MSELVHSLRELNILVVHPRDSMGGELLQQISRIGCGVQSAWPVPDNLSAKTDLVIAEMAEGPPDQLKALLNSAGKDGVAFIAVIGYENPSVLQGIFEVGAHAVMTKPVRATGVMSNILMARKTWLEQVKAKREYEKIKTRMDHLQTINDAKFILMRHHGVNDKEAYSIIRKHAMSKRTTTVEIAQAIIQATGILSDIR